MNRLPSLLRSTPPSPRTPSVTRMPRTLGGQTMPVGWNWTNSMSTRSAPAPRARGVAAAVVLRGVGGDFPGLADPAGGQHHRLGLEDDQPPGLAPVGDRAGDAALGREHAHH